MPRVEQIRTLLYNGEEIGMGFNSDTGKAVGSALAFDEPTRDPAQEVFSQASIVTSQQSLTSAMDLSLEAAGRYGLFSASLKVDFHTNTTFNSTSSFVLARSVVRNQITRGRNFRVKPEAQALLDANRLAEFQTAFGDSFVRGRISGGEYYALIRVTSLDMSVQKKLSVQLEAEMNGVVAGGSFKGAFNMANGRSESRSEYSVTFYQKGGAGGEETGTTLDIDDIRTRLETFPSAVRDRPFPYQVEVATYDTIPLPLPTKEQREAFLEALADANAKKLLYMQQRNDLQFAIDHPEFFFDPPSADLLVEGVGVCTHAINAVTSHAVRLSRGEIDPPQLFDPAAAGIVIPTIRLKRRTSEHARTFVDWYLLRNDPGILADDAVYIAHLEQEGRSRLQDFEAIRDPNGDPVRTDQLRAAALAPVIAQMSEFSITEKPVTALGHLPDMLPHGLERLSFWSCGLQDIRGISRFGALQELRLTDNRIDDIAELADLKRLRWLSLSQNGIADLTPLEACGDLEFLDISGNHVAALAPVVALTKLTGVILAGLNIRVVNDVATARIDNNPLLSVDALRTIPALANPFLLADELKVRFGVLRDGTAAQFTGLAKRVGRSHVFDVTLSRGPETMTDRWVLSAFGEALTLFEGFQANPAFANYILVSLVSERELKMRSMVVARSDRMRSAQDPAVEDSATSSRPSVSAEVSQ